MLVVVLLVVVVVVVLVVVVDVVVLAFVISNSAMMSDIKSLMQNNEWRKISLSDFYSIISPKSIV